MSKPVILTGLRANNDLQIGNYFGALLPLIDMAKSKADDYQINLFVPDLHSFTTPVDHTQLKEGIMNVLRVFIAAGLPIDHPNVHIYRQSYIPAHSELAWILDCFTGMGEMNRMTQFKDKSAKLDAIDGRLQSEGVYRAAPSKDRISVGLFNYPVLMASDILLYGANYIPVGEDQTQHLEFVRDLAERMNNQFGELFVVPEPVQKQHELFGKDQGLRIKDLADPTKKMSKSDETGKGVIFLSDTPEEARKKIMSATTDSVGEINYDKANQPGIVNLIDIMALLKGVSSEDVANEYKGQNQYGTLKAMVADEVGNFLRTFQERLSQVDDDTIMTKLAESEAAMTLQANDTLLKAQKAVGLR